MQGKFFWEAKKTAVLVNGNNAIARLESGCFSGTVWVDARQQDAFVRRPRPLCRQLFWCSCTLCGTGRHCGSRA